MDEMKPVFRDVASADLLKRCVHGETQNANESLNSVIWTRIPNTVFVRTETLRFGVCDAELCFSSAVVKTNDVLNMLGVRSGSNRVRAEIATLSISREARKNKRAQKRRKE
jgi:hypothetical protein